MFRKNIINFAILATQFEMRGFVHPIGTRMKLDNKFLDAIPGNFIAFACGYGRKGKDPTHIISEQEEISFDEYLSACKLIAKKCDLPAHEGIQYLIKDIIILHDKRRAEAGLKGDQYEPYLPPLLKTYRFGRATLALAEAFDVEVTGVDKHKVQIIPKLQVK